MDISPLKSPQNEKKIRIHHVAKRHNKEKHTPGRRRRIPPVPTPPPPPKKEDIVISKIFPDLNNSYSYSNEEIKYLISQLQEYKELASQNQISISKLKEENTKLRLQMREAKEIYKKNDEEEEHIFQNYMDTIKNRIADLDKRLSKVEKQGSKETDDDIYSPEHIWEVLKSSPSRRRTGTGGEARNRRNR